MTLKAVLFFLGALVMVLFVASKYSSQLQCFKVSEPVTAIFESFERDYSNGPTSLNRPRCQFIHHEPINASVFLFVISASKDPRSEELRDVAAFVASQSWGSYEWIIVNDHSSAHGWRELEAVARMNSRVRIFNATSEETGLGAARNVGLKHATGVYVTMLDDDDVWELTGWEKSIWLLESNPSAVAASAEIVNHGRANFTWRKGFHYGRHNFDKENVLTANWVIRRDAIVSSKCAYNPALPASEDWDFWLCLAEREHWGLHIPEPLFWYRTNSVALRQQRWPSLMSPSNFQRLKNTIRSLHAGLESYFPSCIPESFSAHVAHRAAISTVWMTNKLVQTSAGRILFILPFLQVGGADLAMYRLAEVFTLRGFAVTVAVTLYSGPESVALRGLWMGITHDVFVLPTILRLVDQPRFLQYLMESRSIQAVVISNAELGYLLLPVLRRNAPIFDFVHHPELEWKRGGFGRKSVDEDRLLDRTFSASRYAAQWMIGEGKPQSKVSVAHVGIDVSQCYERRITIPAILAVRSDAVVVLYLSRLVNSKFPLLAVEAMERVLARSDRPVVCIFAGNGPLAGAVKRRLQLSPFAAAFIFLGSVNEDEKYQLLTRSHVLLLPSRNEGLPISMGEALCMGLSVVGSNVGGVGELVSSECGRLVDPGRDDAPETGAFVTALLEVIGSVSLHKAERHDCRDDVIRKFNYRRTLLQSSSDVTSFPRDFAGRKYDDINSVALTPYYEEYKGICEVHDVQLGLQRKGSARNALIKFCNRKGNRREFLESTRPYENRWCVWSNTKPQKGWQYNGHCWSAIESSSFCWRFH